MPKRPAARLKPKAARQRKPSRKVAGALALPAECILGQTADLKKSLSKAFARNPAITLDLRALARIDAAALQLLAAFVRDRQARNRTVLWQGVPAWFTDAAQRLDMAAALAIERT